MTDYAATLAARAALTAIEMQRLEMKRQRMGAQDGDDVELWKRERQLEDVLNGRWIEIQTEIERTSALISQVATLEGRLRDKDDEIKANWEHLKRLEAEVKRLKKLAPKEPK
jgi:predicted  nucleic acid-binding Zn-ribbon protein